MIASLIRRIARQLDNDEIPYMIIGGQAVLFYGRARLTRDIDITLGLDTDEFARIQQLCANLNLEPLVKDPRDFATKTKVLPVVAQDSKVRVDLIFSFTPYEAQAIERANEVLLEGCTVRFASCEDVIVHKMVAGRPIDLEDVRHLLAKNRQTIDLAYLKDWLLQFSQLPGHEQILHDFEALWNQ
jgi:predicted nucleotidyltransferase